ncbi:alpha-hydroxyketone-type quorum-sensing autoinducer synthase [Salinisphaera sp. Q1T1-3]|uniref:alpha-hydroxyketone-type quorum-sensing autoinducer synthase n=1 Tax=Salinisphaera sp. Q1T1-3 TaxID=2321229 RepID=UPI000E725BCA|nr:alpha-hydroxyketone-type quorum-sensing autoinducer synthase [Salinisphaera sp. Q1T1-3]RJS95081.1 quorum-sensing autoinducer synthase [Salinisphaera sp. Q1T1-3]
MKLSQAHATQSCTADNAVEPNFLRTHVDVYFRERVEKTWNGGHIMHGIAPGEDAIMLVSNDYLSLADRPEIARAQIDKLADSDNTMVMSAVYLHGENAQDDFEADMAAWMGLESSLLCQSGYAANVGLIQSISAPETPVYIDMMAHASLWQGVQAAGLTPRPFRHNSASHLASQIERHGAGLVIIDSIYSTNGSVAPLAEIVDAADRTGCVMIVDESHSLGTHGPNGAGMVAELGLQSKVHFVTASLAKAFAGRAGLIACSDRLRQFIKYNAFPAIFSSALLPAEVAGLAKTLDLIRDADIARRRLHANATYLRTALDELGYNVSDSQSQIVALEAGAEQQTMVLRDALEARGVFGSVFCAPATAAKRSLIRLSVNAALTHDQLDHVITVCGEIREMVDMANWPSTKRRQRSEDAGMASRAG